MRMLTRKNIDRAENAAIVLLVCTALILCGKTGLISNIGSVMRSDGADASAQGQSSVFIESEPSALAVGYGEVQTGLKYVPEEVIAAYSDGLDDLLVDAVNASDSPTSISQPDWNAVLEQADSWIYYEFLFDIPVSQLDGESEEEAGQFLLIEKNGVYSELYYRNTVTKGTWHCTLEDNKDLIGPAIKTIPNGTSVMFACQDQMLGQCDPMLLLPSHMPQLPVYTVVNPFSAQDDSYVDMLLKACGFNVRASSIYSTTDNTVIREGSDTLRILNDGWVTYHSSESDGSMRARSSSETDLRSYAAEILKNVTEVRNGQSAYVCSSVDEAEPGKKTVTFSCLLNGIEVMNAEQTWAASFEFEGRYLTDFTICCLQYISTESPAPVLPVRQAAAAAVGAGEQGNLALCYRESGEGQLSPVWISHVVPEEGQR